VYPALLPLMRTPRLPVVDWTDAPADLNGLVRFAERRNLVSARVPSHFKSSLFVSITELYLLTPNVNYSGRTAPLMSEVALYIFIQQIYVLNILNTVYTLRFFLFKCSLFHNSNVFGSCIIHILYTGCAKIKKKQFRRQKVKGKGFIWPLNPHSVKKHGSTKAAHNIISRNDMASQLTVTPSKLVFRSALRNNSSHTGSRYRKSATVWFSRTWRMCRATCWMASATAQIPSYVYPWNREYSGPRRESYSNRYSSAVCNR